MDVVLPSMHVQGGWMVGNGVFTPAVLSSHYLHAGHTRKCLLSWPHMHAPSQSHSVTHTHTLVPPSPLCPCPVTPHMLAVICPGHVLYCMSQIQTLGPSLHSNAPASIVPCLAANAPRMSRGGWGCGVSCRRLLLHIEQERQQLTTGLSVKHEVTHGGGWRGIQIDL